MLIRVSQLIAFSLLFLVGCSEKPINVDSSYSSSSKFPSSSPSDIRNPEWSYGVFDSDVKTPSGSYEGSYMLRGGPVFEKQNKQVEWIVEYSIPLTENTTSVQTQINDSLVRVELANGFRAEFRDNSGVFLGAENLNEEGQGNRRRYTLRIPNNIWARWSEVAIVKILKGKYKENIKF
jgi:hypothetical protein